MNPLGSAVTDFGAIVGGNPRQYPVCALDEQFKTLSLRTGGPGAGLYTGKGLWAGQKWFDVGDDVFDGYGFGQFSTPGMFPDLYDIQPDGLHLRSRHYTDAELAKLPADKRTFRGQRPIASSRLGTFFALRVRPPFHVRVVATLPTQTLGIQPFPAIWLYTCARKSFAENTGREAEIDIIEVFGHRAESNFHNWPCPLTEKGEKHTKAEYPLAGFDWSLPTTYDLEARTWGVRLSIMNEGLAKPLLRQMPWVNGMKWDQEWQLLLDNSSGIQWSEQGKPFLYPDLDAPTSDMIVHSVQWFCEREDQIWRNGI